MAKRLFATHRLDKIDKQCFTRGETGREQDPDVQLNENPAEIDTERHTKSRSRGSGG